VAPALRHWLPGQRLQGLHPQCSACQGFLALHPFIYLSLCTFVLQFFGGPPAGRPRIFFRGGVRIFFRAPFFPCVAFRVTFRPAQAVAGRNIRAHSRYSRTRVAGI
jgi:hypothetical protein